MRLLLLTVYKINHKLLNNIQYIYNEIMYLKHVMNSEAKLRQIRTLIPLLTTYYILITIIINKIILFDFYSVLYLLWF